MKFFKLFFVLSFVFTANYTFSQNLKDEAAYAFDAKDYKKAYELYDKLYTESPKNFEYKFRLGYSSLNYPEKKLRSIEIFEDIKRIDKSADVDYYLAKAYHTNYKFDEAISSYEAYISEKSKKEKLTEEDIAFINDAKLGVKNCKNGKELMSKKVIADIKNIGAPLNTSESEYVPVISADESILIYTYVGKNTTGGKVNDDLKPDAEEGYYHEDIYIAKKATDSTYSAGVSIGSNINTKGNDAPIGLSPDGTTLFTFASTNKDKGDIYVSKLTGDEWSKPIALNSNINTEEWEGSCSISSDGRFLYFASERAGGLGGRDLYISENINGDWAPAVNLGPTINTPYNEDAPFIHPDGITLFFSSEGHQSIGGYDIMYTIKQENNWLAPMSMGIPLNTTEDDRYYVINAKGERGYFSSNRGGSGGLGNADIYMVEPGVFGDKPILALLKGRIFADDKPIEAKLTVTKKATGEAIGPYYSNSKTGKFLMALAPGNGYKIHITVAVPGFEPIEEELDIENLTKFVEINKDFYVYSPGYNNKMATRSMKSILDSLAKGEVATDKFKNDVVTNEPVKKPKVEKAPKTPKVKAPVAVDETPVVTTPTPCDTLPLPSFADLKGKSLNDIENYKKLLSLAGTHCSQGMMFKVQIAAYRHPENYKYDFLKKFGEASVKDYPDGITRFTQLEFSTLKDAEIARQQIIAKGQKDAWIVAFVDGKRYTLEELIMLDFLGKAIN